MVSSEQSSERGALNPAPGVGVVSRRQKVRLNLPSITHHLFGGALPDEAREAIGASCRRIVLMIEVHQGVGAFDCTSTSVFACTRMSNLVFAVQALRFDKLFFELVVGSQGRGACVIDRSCDGPQCRCLDRAMSTVRPGMLATACVGRKHRASFPDLFRTLVREFASSSTWHSKCEPVRL